jgi:hypothetical protein
MVCTQKRYSNVRARIFADVPAFNGNSTNSSVFIFRSTARAVASEPAFQEVSTVYAMIFQAPPS